MSIITNIRSHIGALLNRASDGGVKGSALPAGGSGSLNLTDQLKQANRWREQYNPLRGLDMARAIGLREAWLRGEYADIHWLYYHIEKSYPELMALRTRRLSAIGRIDWTVKTCGEDKPGYDETAAEAQAAVLREAYDRLDNLNAAITHLATATFRGFSALEKHAGSLGDIEHLEPCDTWNIVRDGLRGRFALNPKADSVNYRSIAPELRLNPDNDPNRWIIREVETHIDWVAMILFIRANLCEKDWDAFVEIYGVPGATVIGPPNIPPGKETEYETAARDVAQGGSGYLPNGADIRYPSDVRGNAPFRDRLQYLTEQLILVGTGGLLTMLSQPTGPVAARSGKRMA